MKKLVFALVLLGMAGSVYGQESNSLWRAIPPGKMTNTIQPVLHPAHYRGFSVSELVLKELLGGAAHDPDNAGMIALPTPDGHYREFRIWERPVMEEPLAIKYADIHTYTAEAVDDHRVTAKIDYSPLGFHALVFDAANTYFIDPWSGMPDGRYISYYRRDYQRPDGAMMVCEVKNTNSISTSEMMLYGKEIPGLQGMVNGTTRKTYRLALAADSEYCAAVGGAAPTKGSVLARMIISLNRVNGVYERELAVSMLLVANDDTLIFLTGSPYLNSSGSTMMSQNQSVIDARIGDANYDIGHVFSTGGGGIAQRAKVCESGSKAEGVTGLPSPVGDAFDIDFVAHEMGHQFGGDHTFNANTGSCNNNGVAAFAYEPGSGTTIMAYAGFCGNGNDYQPHSDAYFHAASLEEITAYITIPGPGAGCATTTVSPNNNATLPVFAASYAIPYKTPFELTAPIATDATADTLSYCWEERDLGDFTSNLAQTHLQGPLFRSFPPTLSATRIFPTIVNLVRGTTPVGEKLPDTGRSMTFRLTERDVYQGWGDFNLPDDAITLQVVNTGAPFTVTAPDTPSVWTGGTKETVRWNVVGTDAAPISATNVDIYLSVDSGYTFPVLIKANTPNDGSEEITVPDVDTTHMARIKVKGSGNVFFNMSPGVFTINHSKLVVLSSVQIMPVPAQDFLQVNIPAAFGKMDMLVSNIIGQTIFKTQIAGTNQIPVGAWPRGLYQVVLLDESGEKTVRRVVLR